MAQFPHSTLTILRRKQVEIETGYSRSTIYLRITQGLWPKPVSLGARAVGLARWRSRGGECGADRRQV